MDENSYLTSYPADVCTNTQKEEERDDKYLTSYPDNVHDDVHTEKEGQEVLLGEQQVEDDESEGYVNYNGAFTLDVKSMLNENLGGILGGTQC